MILLYKKTLKTYLSIGAARPNYFILIGFNFVKKGKYKNMLLYVVYKNYSILIHRPIKTQLLHLLMEHVGRKL